MTESLQLLSRLFPPKRRVSSLRKKGSCSGSELEDDLLMELMEKGNKRRTTDRSDSSESSDSGVATLSPSTSDSTELISSPYSPCCDLSSDASSTCSTDSPPPPPTAPHLPTTNTTTNLLGHPIMTAVSAVLAASDKKPPPTIATFINNTYNNHHKSFGKVSLPAASPPKNGKTMNILAAAISFHQQQEKQKLANNNNTTSVQNKNQVSPSKKARLDDGPTTNKRVPLIVAKKVSVSSAVKKVECRKRKLVEETTNTVSCLEATATATVVQNGRVCSVEESLKVTTTTCSAVVSTKTVGGVSGGCGGSCMWKACQASEAASNLLEHIQNVHVTHQTKGEGYVCLWEGCKVYNVKSSSLSWLERHILTHSGNKPYKCFIPGCGQSFGVRGALERHVNSHMSLGGAISLPNRKMESSPMKGGRRKKQRCRKQRLNIGQHVDYFDKRVMEVIKHRLAGSLNSPTFNHSHPHHCTFRGDVLAKQTVQGQEAKVLVQWFPPSIIPDEWMPLREYKPEKRVPLTQISKDKLPLLFPTLLPSPPPRQRVRRKWSSSSSSGTSTPSTTTTTTTPSSPAVSLSSTEDEGIAHCSSSRSSRSCSSNKYEEEEEEEEEDEEDEEDVKGEDDDDDWAVDVLLDNMLLS